MSFSPVPQFMFPSLESVPLDFLKKRGIALLMLDLDNTIAHYGAVKPSQAVERWLRDARQAGIELFIVSNCRKKGRVEAFAELLGLEFVKSAMKPWPGALRATMRRRGYARWRCALLGDQVFTDGLAANLAGITSIVTVPIAFTHPMLYVRYIVEIPFRRMCRNTCAATDERE
jgi:HAD superfamily phosphatase (TIGR01668 family)